MLDKKTYQLLQGSTLLDAKLFNKKKNFFYSTSYDILIKGDCGNSASSLEIFKNIRKKSEIRPNDFKKENTMMQSLQSRNKISKKIFNRAKSSNVNAMCTSRNKYRTLLSNRSMANANNNNQNQLSFKRSQTTIKKLTPNYFSDSFNRSNSAVFMGNNMESHRSFISCLDDKLSKLDIKINKMNKEEIFKVPSGFASDQRTKVLSLLRDYFPIRPFMIMKQRYNKLYGNEHYLKKIKKLKSRVSLDSIKFSRSLTKGEIEDDENDNEKKKPSFLKVVNGGASYNRKVVFNKYDTIGKVKILNIPKDFYNDITGLNDKYSIGESNVNEMYSMVDQKEQKIIDFANHYYYSREKKYTFNEKLNEINDKFTQVEIDGKKIKNKILRLKSYLNDKSPLISDKIFAYIDDSPKGGKKKNQSKANLPSSNEEL